MPLLLQHSVFEEKVISHKKNGFQFQTQVTKDDRKVDAEKTLSGKLCMPRDEDEEEAIRKWEIVNEEMILYYWQNFWIRFSLFSFTRGNSLVVTYVFVGFNKFFMSSFHTLYSIMLGKLLICCRSLCCVCNEEMCHIYKCAIRNGFKALNSAICQKS